MSGPPVGVTELMHTALIAVHAFARPENWNDPEDPEQAEAWALVDAAMLAYKQWHDAQRIAAALNAQKERAPPTMTPEEARQSQSWKGMSGAIAYHLIDRHADNWADISVMMDAWLEANALNAQAGVVEALEELLDEAECWFDLHHKRGMTKTDYRIWLTMGRRPKAIRNARAALAAVKGVDRG